MSFEPNVYEQQRRRRAWEAETSREQLSNSLRHRKNQAEDIETFAMLDALRVFFERFPALARGVNEEARRGLARAFVRSIRDVAGR